MHGPGTGSFADRPWLASRWAVSLVLEDQLAIRSSTNAPPWPPPMQRVARARVLFETASSVAAVRRRRAPVAPTGWPRAIAPPFGLSLAESISPSAFARPSSFAANESLAKALRQASTCAAKASLISITSMLASVQPASRRALALEYTGPSPMRAGSQPDQAHARSLHIGWRPSSFARRSVVTSIA